MIFVTVGTHEQQFDRLVKEVDRLRKNGDIEEEVIAQIGFGTYEPVSCQWSRFYPYQKMCEYVDEARIVITHGGPSSFLAPDYIMVKGSQVLKPPVWVQELQWLKRKLAGILEGDSGAAEEYHHYGRYMWIAGRCRKL